MTWPWPDPTNKRIQELEAKNAELERKLAEAEARERRLRSAVRRWRQMSQNAFTEKDFDGLKCAATEVEDILATAQAQGKGVE